MLIFEEDKLCFDISSFSKKKKCFLQQKEKEKKARLSYVKILGLLHNKILMLLKSSFSIVSVKGIFRFFFFFTEICFLSFMKYDKCRLKKAFFCFIFVHCLYIKEKIMSILTQNDILLWYEMCVCLNKLNSMIVCEFDFCHHFDKENVYMNERIVWMGWKTGYL